MTERLTGINQLGELRMQNVWTVLLGQDEVEIWIFSVWLDTWVEDYVEGRNL